MSSPFTNAGKPIFQPNATCSAAIVSAAAPGNSSTRDRYAPVDLRHASSGPTPVSESNTKPSGTIHLL